MVKIADRMKRLGTETAFAVGAEAGALKRLGKKIYPFHLGDMNIKTPQNIIDSAFKHMNDGKTGYCPCDGVLELREALSEDIGKARGLDYGVDNVSIQPGGKPTIGKFLMALMDVGDEVLYPNPGYPIYESQIDFHGGKGVPYTFKEGKDGFELDLEGLKKSVTPKTKLLIYNNYQNPMSCSSSDQEMKEIAEFAIENDIYVLSDEAYFDLVYDGKGKSIASLPGMQERTVILYTFSKKFAMTGWRLGGAIGPAEIIKQFSRLNVNDESCSNHFIQWAAIEALKGDQSGSKKITKILKERRDVAVKMLNSIEGFKCYNPDATFYLFPNVTQAIRKLRLNKVEEFRKLVLDKTGVSFCTREHFGRPLPGETQKYIRLAYSGIEVDQIKEGLAKLKEFIENS